MSKYHDDETRASDPGGVRLSDEKLRRFHPELYTARAALLARLPLWFPVHLIGTSQRWRDVIDEHIRLGDSRAAMVMTLEPLIVAAYSDELDCVALLEFAQWVRNEHGLCQYDRLLTVNTYSSPDQTPEARDLIFGPKQCGQWVDFWPIIADFVTDDADHLQSRKARIGEEEWDRTWRMGERLMTNPKAKPRVGAPLHSLRSAPLINTDS